MADPIVYPNRAAALRAKLMAQAVPPPKPLEIDGVTFWIRTPVIEDRTKVGEMAGLKATANKDGSVNMGQVPLAAMLAAALIVLAVDEDGQPICTPVDLDVLMKSQAGGWVAQLGEACLKRLNGDDRPGEASGETPAGASPSSSPTA